MPVLTVTNRTASRLPVNSVVNVLEANESRTLTLTSVELEQAAPKLIDLAAKSLITWSVAPSASAADNAAEPVLGGATVLSGSGSPMGVVKASPGCLYVNTAGGAGATLWVKESGVNTTGGWAAK